jgi:class 3 adenylate cyclase
MSAQAAAKGRKNSNLSPQCSICGTVLQGLLSCLFRVAGIKRSPRNPNICSRCDTHVQEGRLIEVTVLFADLSSFTELTQELGAERTHKVVDAFLRMASDAVIHFGGFIDKYIGDAVMALFNAPVRLADHSRKAVGAAVELQSGMTALRERFGMELQAAAGIASGWARVGRVGSEDSKDYTAIGDVVNLAARLEGKTNPGEILVSRETYEKVQADFPDVQAEKLALKGFKELVVAYRLRATVGAPRIEESPERESKHAISWGAVVFGILGAPCAVTTLIGPLAVVLGIGTLFGLSGALAFLDRSAIRIPVLILATLAALANLYTLWYARKIRSQEEAREQTVGITALERRRILLVLSSAIGTLVIVVFEIIAHIFLHDTPL